MPTTYIIFQRMIMLIFLSAIFSLSTVFLPIPAYGEPIASSREPLIRIGLLTGQKKATVSANAEFGIFTMDNRKNDGAIPFITKYPAATPLEITANGAGVLVNGKAYGGKSLGIALVDPPTTKGYKDYCLEINQNPYRGEFEIQTSHSDSKFTLINILPLEQYLCGILSKEMSPEWPQEALKAQAVAARTYVLYNLRRHQSEGFNVCATTDCQVYGGNASEDFRTTRAVESTRGLVMTYQGKIISAPFHASSGGYTENSENVWGYHLPYLRSVEDMEKGWPNARWERRISAQELSKTIEKSGQHIGKIKTIELSRLNLSSPISADRTSSGRVKTLRVIGTTGECQLSGAKLRSLLALSSTLFDVQVITMGKVAFNAKTASQSISSEEDTIVVTGYGKGHGVGLAQWGSRLMAEKNLSRGQDYFRSILHHYYQDIDIVKQY